MRGGMCGEGGVHGEGGMHGERGACMVKRAWQRVCAWQKGGVHGERGVCVAKRGGVHGMHPPTRYGRYMRGRYASYWNAFLCHMHFIIGKTYMKLPIFEKQCFRGKQET